MSALAAVGSAVWIGVAFSVVAWMVRTPPLPKRAPLPTPDLAETADDMAVTSPQVLADIFRRESARLPH